MNSKINPPAFPCTGENYNHPDWSSEGMTLRDYFAAKAMQSIIQARATLEEKEYPDDSYGFAVSCGMNGSMELHKDGGPKYRWIELVAEEAYECADAMLEARKQ